MAFSVVARCWLVAVALVLGQYVEPPPCDGGRGCISNETEVDDEFQALFHANSADLKQATQLKVQAEGANVIFAEFTPLKYKYQIVAGVNYFVRVRIDAALLIDVFVYEGFEFDVSLVDVKMDVQENDPISDFGGVNIAHSQDQEPVGVQASEQTLRESEDCGGCVSDETDLNDHLKSIFETNGKALMQDALEQVQSQGANAIFTEFTPVRFRSQAVAGYNFFVRTRVGEGLFIDLYLFEGPQSNLLVMDVKMDVKADDPISAFGNDDQPSNNDIFI